MFLQVLLLIIFLFFLHFSHQDADFFTYWATMHPNKFQGKTVVITGASGLFGKNLAHFISAYLDKGTLILMGRSQMTDLVQELLKKNPFIKVIVLELDLMQIKSIIKASEQLSDYRIDYFYHNAGMRYKNLVERTPPETDLDLIKTNFFGNIYLTKCLLKQFQKDGTHLIVTGSIGGIIPSPLRTTYVATKHALQGFYSSLRLEKVMKITLLNIGPFGEKEVHRVVDLSVTASTARIPVLDYIEESWIGQQPVLLFTYLYRYCPVLARWIDLRFEISQKMVRKFTR